MSLVLWLLTTLEQFQPAYHMIRQLSSGTLKLKQKLLIYKLARIVPVLLKATELTERQCPYKLAISVLVSMFQSLIV